VSNTSLPHDLPRTEEASEIGTYWDLVREQIDEADVSRVFRRSKSVALLR